MTDEMDRTSDDSWLPESGGDGTGTSEGDFPSFEEALRAHGFEVEPPRIADDPGVVGPESDEDERLSTDDDSTAPILPGATGERTAGGQQPGPESSLAALATSWIPASNVAAPVAQSRGSVFGTVLTRPASAPWGTEPEAVAQVAPERAAEEALPATAGTAPVPAAAAEAIDEVAEPNLLDALAALDEAPAWTAGEAGVIEMTTTEVSEVWDARGTAESDAGAAGADGPPQPSLPGVERRKARRRRKDNARNAKAAAEAEAAAGTTPPGSTQSSAFDPVWSAGEAGVVEMTNDEVTEAWDAATDSADRAAQADEVEDRWWIEPVAAPEDAGPKLPQPPATLAEPRPPVPSASLFTSRLAPTQTEAPEVAATTAGATPLTAEEAAGAEFVGYDAAAAARATAAEAAAHPSTKPAEDREEPERKTAPRPSEPHAPLDDFEARLRAATEPLGYVAPTEELADESPAGQASEWSGSKATWEELHDDPWAAQAVADQVAPPHEREPFTYEAPVAQSPEAEAPAAEPSDEASPEPEAPAEARPDQDGAAAAVAPFIEAEPAAPADAAVPAPATGGTPTAPSGPSLPPTPPSLLRTKSKRSRPDEPGVFERVAARSAEPGVGIVHLPGESPGDVEDGATPGASSSAEERGDLWHLVSDKADAGAAPTPTKADRMLVFLTFIAVVVIVVLVLGFLFLFTNIFH